MRIRRSTKSNGAGRITADNFMPKSFHSCSFCGLETEIAFVDPSALVLNVGLIKNDDTIFGTFGKN